MRRAPSDTRSSSIRRRSSRSATSVTIFDTRRTPSPSAKHRRNPLLGLEGYAALLSESRHPQHSVIARRKDGLVSVREWVAGLEAKGLSPSRIRQARQVLFSSLELAVEAGYIPSNPAAGVKIPRERPREMRFLMAVEVEQLASVVPAQYSTLVFVLAYGGLRWGEVAALRRHRIDALAGRLQVAESLSDVGGELHFGTTKNHRGRVVTVPPFLKAKLNEHLTTWIGSEPEALVFQSPEGTPLRNTNFRRRVWQPALKVAGLVGLRIHDLRHTAVALLIAQGAHPKAIQAHLGHSSIQVTLDHYGHLFPADIDRLAARLEETRQAAVDSLAAWGRPGRRPTAGGCAKNPIDAGLSLVGPAGLEPATKGL